jgi:polar amino acid transport system ATP-binding protein
MVCLIGASGSGKSTLLRCINLLEPIDDGAIFLDGVDIAEPGLDPQPVRRASASCSSPTTFSRI